MRSFLVFCAAVMLAFSAGAQFPLDPGESMMTCFSDNNPNAPVLAFVDIRDPAANGAVVNTNWNALHDTRLTWTRQGLGGEVFGIALDDATPPNVYVTSTTVYTTAGLSQTAPGSGQVFKINGVTGVAAPLGPPLPNTGQGLGNIAFDPASKNLFVTNFRTGAIYRLDRNSGAVLGTFDPQFSGGAATPNGYAPVGERLFGIAVDQGRVYFARWSPSEVYSIPTTLTGTPTLEFALPPGNGVAVIADLEFTASGDLLVAERGMSGPEVLTVPHQARVLRYRKTGTTWSQVTTYPIGIFSGTNASGGVAYSCATERSPEFVVATGDALQFNPDTIYGLQITPAAGGTLANSYLVDADGSLTTQDKTQIGDVDVYNTCGDCSQVTIAELLCTTDGTGDFILRFTVKNLSSLTAFHLFLVGLPAGVTATQTYFPLPGLQQGQTSAVLQTRIHNAPAGPFSFKLSLHQQNLALCCAQDVTVTPPDCDCAQVVDHHGPTCDFTGGYNYTFSLQNLFAGPAASYVLISPDTPANATFNPNVFDLTANPMTLGQTRTFTTNIRNAPAGGQVCFLVSTHNADVDQCCAIRHCVPIPSDCWWLPFDPDDIFAHRDTVVSVEGTSLTAASPSAHPELTFPLLPGTTGVDLEWRPVPGPLAAGSFIEQRFEGSVDGGAAETIAAMRTVRTATGYDLRTSFPALDATRYTYVFLRDGVVLGSERGVAANVPAQCNGCNDSPPTTDVHTRFIEHGESRSEVDDFHCPPLPEPPETASCMYTVFTMPDVDIRLQDRPAAFLTDEVRVYAEDARPFTSLEFSSLTFEGQGMPAIVFTGLGTTVDRDASEDLDLSLSSGFHQESGTAIPRGSDDSDWTVLDAVNGPQPARVVANPFPTWRPALAGSEWISVNANAVSLPGRPLLEYENCFCIGLGADAAELNLQLRGDDIIDGVFLNGTRISSGGGTFSSASPLAVSFSGAVGGAGPFVKGRNCVRVDVRDSGGILTGLNVSGNVRATNGACAEDER